MDLLEMALPDDALANILRCLPPRDLAASRCVCKAWRAVVDARGLLLAHLLPHSVRGIFLNYIDYRCPCFFARPSTHPRIDGNLDFLPGYSRSYCPIRDHCNGLLLYGGSSEFFVVNPATRRWERLPRMDASDYVAYLVFDPAVSQHYEVFLIPRRPEKPKPFDLIEIFRLLDDISAAEDTDAEEDSRDELVESPQPEEDPCRLMEWPPSPYTLHVFSSSTGQWQQRSFAREGEAARTLADVRLDSLEPERWGPRWRYGVYWRGALYVHCRGAFVMRLSLSNDKYQVIKTPINIEESKQARPYLGRSEKGLYFATIHNDYQLRVWILNESRGQIDWVLKHDIDLEPSALWTAVRLNHRQGIDGPWILQDDNNDEDGNKMIFGEDFEWNSDDDDNVLGIEDGDEENNNYINFLGFHPYREVVFLKVSFTGVAYHLNSSKVQYLGKLRPKGYNYTMAAGVYEAFPYTPCMIGELSENA